jgi:hypothetical protein
MSIRRTNDRPGGSSAGARPARWWAGTGVRLLVTVLATAGTSVVAGSAGAATAGAPFTDPDAIGYIGLCNQTGRQVTSGTLDARPFTWEAVSSVPAKSPYNNAARRATLEAFLPVQGLPAGDWSGETLTAASQYSDPTAPMAAGTTRDTPLAAFVETYPPEWDGFIELRLYLSTANQPAQITQYPALDVQVTGTTWHAVGGGPVNCTVGKATSLETTLLPTTTSTSPTTPTTAVTTPTTPAPSTQPGGATPTTTPATGGGGNGGAGGGSGSGPAAAQGHGTGAAGAKGIAPARGGDHANRAAPQALRTPAGPSGDGGPVALAVLLGLLAAGVAAGLMARRRRRRPGPGPKHGEHKLTEAAKSDKNHVSTMKGS